jgi:hypothetical protein
MPTRWQKILVDTKATPELETSLPPLLTLRNSRTKGAPMKKLLFAILTFLLVPSLAFASPTNYELTLNVTAADFNVPPCPLAPVPGLSLFDCPDGTINRTYICHFTYDTGVVTDFFLQIGVVIWDQNNPAFISPGVFNPVGSDFAGFRGGPPTNNFNLVGFPIVNGCALGGVFGPADWPFIDFHCETFFAADYGDNHLSGFLTLTKIPEPSSWMLLGLGLMGLAMGRIAILR